jgi:hypothetical protein
MTDNGAGRKSELFSVIAVRTIERFSVEFDMISSIRSGNKTWNPAQVQAQARW